MYFKKYFNGSILQDTGFAYTDYINNPISTSNQNNNCIYKGMSIVFGRAIVDTLKTAGVSEASYDENNFTLKITNKDPELSCIHSAATINATYSLPWVYKNNWTITGYTATSVALHKEDEYKFYITLVGDPRTVLHIGFGMYTNPSYENVFITRFLGKDRRNNEDIVGYYQYGILNGVPSWSTISSKIYLYDVSNFGTVYGSGYGYTSITKTFKGDDGAIPLIPAIDDAGYFGFEGVYHKPVSLGGSGFYGKYKFLNIDSVEYWFPDANIMVKCPTKLTNYIGDNGTGDPTESRPVVDPDGILDSDTIMRPE